MLGVNCQIIIPFIGVSPRTENHHKCNANQAKENMQSRFLNHFQQHGTAQISQTSDALVHFPRFLIPKRRWLKGIPENSRRTGVADLEASDGWQLRLHDERKPGYFGQNI